ncbi:hypothetical protein Tco_0439256 [Tanacetum coccineum]
MFMASRLYHLNFDYSPYSQERSCDRLPKLNIVKDQLCSSCENELKQKEFIQTKAGLKTPEVLKVLSQDDSRNLQVKLVTVRTEEARNSEQDTHAYLMKRH